MSSVRLKAYFYLLIVTFIWGIAAPIIKYTLQGFDPGSFLVYRFFISALISVGYFAFTRNQKTKTPKKLIPKIVTYALLSTTVSLGALFVGLERTTVLNVNIMTSIMPLLVVIGGAIVFKEKVPHLEKLGALLAFSGTLIAVVLPVISGMQNTVQFTGNLFIIVHMASDITALLLLKQLLSSKVSSGVLANIAFIIGFITLTPFVLAQTPASEIINQVINTPIQYHFGVWYMAILSGTVAYYLRNIGQKVVEVGSAGLFGYLNPLFSAPLAVLWLGEEITPPFIIGAVMIVIGVIIAESRGKIRKKIHPHIPHLPHHR